MAIFSRERRMEADRLLDVVAVRVRERRRPGPGIPCGPSRCSNWTASLRWAVSFLTTTSKPVVSRSRRWTMPGRFSPAEGGERVVVELECVDQGPAPVSAGRVGDHVRRAC